MGARGNAARRIGEAATAVASCALLLLAGALGTASAADEARPRLEIKQVVAADEARPRLEIKQAVIEAEAAEPPASRYSVRAALVPEPDPAPQTTRYRMKATVGGEDVATSCAITDDIFADGFEGTP